MGRFMGKTVILGYVHRLNYNLTASSKLDFASSSGLPTDGVTSLPLAFYLKTEE
jgi:hypothetical protein